MIPRVHAPRSNLPGTWAYLSNDTERVAWTHVLNIDIDDADDAVRFMMEHRDLINAEKRAGGRRGKQIENAFLNFSHSRHPGQEPLTPEQWHAKAQSWLNEMGLGHHYAVLAGHNDEPQDHMHGVVSLIDPNTGKLNKKAVSNIQLKSSRWAQREEEMDGEIRCHVRVENNARRDNGEFVKYRETDELKPLMTRLYRQADSGRAFSAAVAEHGFALAEDRRIVLIGPDGKIYSLFRQIEGAKAREIRAKLADLDLPDIDEAREQQERAGAGNRERSQASVNGPQSSETQPRKPHTDDRRLKTDDWIDRDRAEREWQDKLDKAAIAYAATEKIRQRREAARSRAEIDAAYKINAVQSRHHAELARLYSYNQKERDATTAKLEGQYGPDERRLSREIAALENTLRTRGRIRRAWLSFTGQLEREQRELDNKRKSLAIIQWRRQEAMDALEKKLTVRGDAIKNRQATERREIEREYGQAQAPPRARDPLDQLLENEIRSIEQRELDRDRNPDWQRDGPDLDL